MASYEVEIASSSPFGRVLKDQNSRCSNARAAAFQKNLTEMVRDRLHNCISVSTDENSQSQSVKKVTAPVSSSDNNQEKARNLRYLTKINEKQDDKTDQSSEFNTSQTRILDRWAAKQAREMVSNIEKQSQEAELLSSSSPSSSSCSSNSPSKNDPNSNSNSNSNSNLGASSLVQIWEARSNTNANNNNNPYPASNASRTSSGFSCFEDSRSENVQGIDHTMSSDWETFSDRETTRNSDAGESEKVRIADIIRRLATCTDDNESHLGSGENVSESQWSSGGSSRDRKHPAIPILEDIGLMKKINSPRIRGRQAFTDLLMQMERERVKELHSLSERQAVTKFPQKGRIQSMLRLKCMQRGLGLPPSAPSQLKQESAKKETLTESKGPSIMQLREKFKSGTENVVATPTPTPNPTQNTSSCSCTASTSKGSNVVNEEESSALRAKEVSVSEKSTEVGGVVEEHKGSSSQAKYPPPRIGNADKKKISKSDSLVKQETAAETCMRLKTCMRLNVHNRNVEDGWGKSNCQKGNPDGGRCTQKTAETSTNLDVRSKNEIVEDQNVNNVNREENPNASAVMEDQNEQQRQEQMLLDTQDNEETASFMTAWYENEVGEEVEEEEEEEEEDYNDQQFFQYNNDWVSEIARPRSHWEKIRKAWYEERLKCSSDNDEIRQLLERKRVSTYLSSDFRITMDRLMSSRSMAQADMEEYFEEEEEDESQDRMRQLLLAHLHRNAHSTADQQEEGTQQQLGEVEQRVDQVIEAGHQRDYNDLEEEEDYHDEEEEEEDDDDEEEEGRSSMSHPFQEAGEYFQSSSTLQLPSPSVWSFRDNEAGDDSEPIAPRPFHSQASVGRRSHESSNRLSIEMEIIYDLRGQMEQLHREMTELRKSVNMNMQTKPQCFNQQQGHSVKVMTNNSAGGATLRRNCCICYEMQVDSLLYRCGHMCTCLKCAHELQWNTGKCPICRAPIDDVVRAYMDS